MEVKELEKEDLVELEVKVNQRTLNFNCKTILSKDNFILIPKIVIQNQTVGFSDQCTVNLIYINEGKAIIWEHVVVKLVSYNGMICHKVTVNGSGKPLNRRRAFRVFIGLDAEVAIPGVKGPEFFPVVLKDLSETGYAFLCVKEIDTGKHVRVRFRDNITIEISGRIIRQEYKENLNEYLYACELTGRHPRLGYYLAKKQSEKLKLK